MTARLISLILVLLCIIGQADMRTFIYTIFSVFGFCAFFLVPAQAAELYVSPETPTVVVGQNFPVTLRLHSNNQEINAVEGTLVYPSSLELASISTKNSFITFWIQNPQKIPSNRTGYSAVRMSGLTPGGVAVAGDALVTFNFIVSLNSQSEKTLLFTLENARVLLNDGQGTPADLTIKNATVSVNNQILLASTVTNTSQISIPDKIAPEQFSVAIARNQNLFNNNWFAAFVARDVGDGIDHYEMQESQEKTPDEKAWVTVVNPAILKDQSRSSYIFVEAFDKAGNKTMVTVSPQNTKYSYSKIAIWCILLLAAIVLIVRLFFLKQQEKTDAQISSQ